MFYVKYLPDILDPPGKYLLLITAHSQIKFFFSKNTVPSDSCFSSLGVFFLFFYSIENMKRLGLWDLIRLQETVDLFSVQKVYLVLSGSFVELILRVN